MTGNFAERKTAGVSEIEMDGWGVARDGESFAQLASLI